MLTKPGIIRGNAITATAGFLLGSNGKINVGLLFAMLIGVSLVIASGCVLNNYLDRAIDNKMARTKQRAMVTGSILSSHAIIFAGILGLGGFLILLLLTNMVATLLVLVGIIFYVLLYTPLKSRTVHATLVGSIAGAVPIAAGYCAATGRFDAVALLLFIILVVWQMPHFYAIAIYRFHDYYGADLPVMPVKKNISFTKKIIILYILGFFIISCLLFVFEYTGYLYLLVMSIVCMAWFFMGLQGIKAKSDPIWARNIFRFSLVVLLVFSIMISINNLVV